MHGKSPRKQLRPKAVGKHFQLFSTHLIIVVLANFLEVFIDDGYRLADLADVSGSLLLSDIGSTC